MNASILDGKKVAAEVKKQLRIRVDALKKAGITPGLATILVGSDPASQIYVNGKHRDCEQVGIASIRKELPDNASSAQLHETICELNEDPSCTGYIVQLPLPRHLDEHAALVLIDPAKDADGLAPSSLGRLVLGARGPLPCTPRGIIELMRTYHLDLNGAKVCVIGRGTTVGRPLGLMLNGRDVNATVTLCHTGTKDLADHCRHSDVVIAAAGVPHMVTASMIADRAVLIDVGVTRRDGKPVGDLAPDVYTKASWVTPNPGGVGPMTRAMLLANIVDAAEGQLND